MTTIKDIAKAAGVAQGTVSNVLNGKGNVSSEKIRQVMDAASALGYVPNERAKLLRKGRSNTLGVILPNIRSKQYIDFYLSFKAYAENHGYSVSQYLTSDDNLEAEYAAIQDVRSSMAQGMAAVSCCSFADTNPYLDEQGMLADHVVFAERRPPFAAPYAGFDYHRAGSELALRALERGFSSLCLLTGSLQLPNESDFFNGFMSIAGSSGCRINHIQTDPYRKLQNIMQMFGAAAPQAIFISNYGFAESVKDIWNTFYSGDSPEIYTVSPMFTMPENDFQKYELNYRQLGKVAAECLIQDISKEKKEKKSGPEEIEEPNQRTGQDRGQDSGQDSGHPCLLLENSGFRDWFADILIPSSKKPLNVLTLDSPSAYTMRNLSRIYTKKTGVPVNITIYSYEEIYEAFNHMHHDSVFDVLRLDVTWLSWFADKILQPLDQIDPGISSCLDTFLDGTINQYSIVRGRVYALPSTPSVQLLYYRKDLFESPIYRRMYHETYRQELRPPQDFKEFNQIARFFTKACTPSSPVEYGATMTLGSTGVAGSEYLARLFSHQENLYNEDFQVTLNSPAAIGSLRELIALKEYSDPKYCSWWTNTATTFAGGNVAMAILYSNYASDLLSHSSRVAGNIGYALTPGRNPVIGGGSLGVSKYTKRPEDALSFIKWMCSEPVSSAATLLGGVSPCRKSYDNYEILNTFPWLNLAKDGFGLAHGRRTPEFSTQPFDERSFLSIIGMAVKNAYSQVMTPEDALNYAQKRYDEQFLHTGP